MDGDGRPLAARQREFERAWEPRPFTSSDGEITHPVYRRGEGPAVLLLHEMTGLSPNCIRLAERIVDRRFTVYLPLLLGDPFDDKGTENYRSPPPCIRVEIERFAAHESSALDFLDRELRRERDGPAHGPA